MITIYYKPECPYCKKALQYCKTNKIKHVKYNVYDYNGKDNVVNALYTNGYLKRKTNVTVPIVFNKGKFIGGSEELVRLRKF